MGATRATKSRSGKDWRHHSTPNDRSADVPGRVLRLVTRNILSPTPTTLPHTILYDPMDRIPRFLSKSMVDDAGYFSAAPGVTARKLWIHRLTSHVPVLRVGVRSESRPLLVVRITDSGLVFVGCYGLGLWELPRIWKGDWC
jgi:hypothetical protein